jgi:FG-GAP-like repeat
MNPTRYARVRRILLWCAALPIAALAAAMWHRGTTEAAGPSTGPSTHETLVIEAAEFFHELPKGDTMSSAIQLEVPWLFNNNAIVLKSAEEAVARVTVPRAGAYRLYVRSHGQAGSSFRMTLNGQAIPTLFGDAASSLRSAGVVDLTKGPLEIRLIGISPAPAVDVIALTTKPDFSDADLLPLQLATDAQLLTKYTVPAASAVKFGDVNGDGKMDFVVLTRSYSAHVFDHDGKELWRYEAPAEGTTLRGEFEAPGAVWDFDQDGFAEVVHWRMGDGGKEWLVIADGRTGTIQRRIDWPTTPLPHVYNNFRTAIARLHAGHPDNLVVLTDSGGQISIHAYTAELKPLWTHVEQLKKDHLGHYLYPLDIDGDGIDEVIVSHLALDAAGKVLWSNVARFPSNHDHADSLRFVDLDGDGKLEALASQSDVGTVVYRALTGEIVWQRPADHTQQIQFGDFIAGIPAPQVVVTARTYGNRQLGEPYLSGQLYWFDRQGELLSKWPRQPLNGNPDFVKGDWRGDGTTELFWYKFRLDRQGKGTLYFAEPVYHMLDFMGSGAEQVIALNNSRGILEVYGSRSAKHGAAKRDVDYRRQIANHTHY